MITKQYRITSNKELYARSFCIIQQYHNNIIIIPSYFVLMNNNNALILYKKCIMVHTLFL